MPAVSFVEAMNRFNVGVVPERLLWMIGRLRFSWKRNVFESKYSVSRLGAIEQLLLDYKLLWKIIYRLGIEKSTMTFYMKEYVWI